MRLVRLLWLLGLRWCLMVQIWVWVLLLVLGIQVVKFYK
jgi:hypothetical protein